MRHSIFLLSKIKEKNIATLESKQTKHLQNLDRTLAKLEIISLLFLQKTHVNAASLACASYQQVSSEGPVYTVSAVCTQFVRLCAHALICMCAAALGQCLYWAVINTAQVLSLAEPLLHTHTFSLRLGPVIHT